MQGVQTKLCIHYSSSMLMVLSAHEGDSVLILFLFPPSRVQFAEQGPSHSHYVQIQAHVQPWQEPHGAHTCLRQPGNARRMQECVLRVRLDLHSSLLLLLWSFFNLTSPFLFWFLFFFLLLISCRPSWFGFSVAFCWSVSDCAESSFLLLSSF